MLVPNQESMRQKQHELEDLPDIIEPDHIWKSVENLEEGVKRCRSPSALVKWRQTLYVGLHKICQESMTRLGSWAIKGKTGFKKLNLSKKNGCLREIVFFLTDVSIWAMQYGNT